jgi:DNA-binding transcriptional ArsR family regulator
MTGDNVGTILAALADPTRRAIMMRAARGPVTPTALAAPLGISLSAVGQHLRMLESAGLVTSAKQGRSRTCHFQPAGMVALEDWARQCRNDWEARLDALGVLLDEMEEG